MRAGRTLENPPLLTPFLDRIFRGPPSAFSIIDGPYAGGTTYALGNQVFFNGTVYQSVINGNIGNSPASSPSDLVADRRAALFRMGGGVGLEADLDRHHSQFGGGW